QTIPVNFENNTSTAVNYTVKKGDSLWLIAKRFNIHVEQLLAWNKLDKKKHLNPGQQLIIQTTQTRITGA
ncbi:MAG: membrane-bound lytic murein transglycosylase D, partial [Planctomycetota bacterium]